MIASHLINIILTLLVSSEEHGAPDCDGVSWIMWAALTNSASVKVKTKLTIKLLCSRLFISVSKVMSAYDRINSFCCTDYGADQP